MKKVIPVLLLVAAAIFLWKWCGREDAGKKAADQGGALRLATTTSVVDSGLLETLLPAYGKPVTVQAVGSGAALKLLDEGKADVAIVHGLDAPRGTAFMHNDFVLVGPRDAAASIAGAGDVKDALRAIAASGRPFVSRADESGTHQRERKLWLAAGVGTPKLIEARAGMKATLARASKEKAFALTDRGTFIANRKSLDLAIVFQGDAELANVYHVVGDRAFADFLRSEKGRALIGAHGVATSGEPLFTPEE